MFDIGFWELGLIALVALLVVGPERLPGLARTLGLWLGKGRRILGSLKEEIDREIRIDEIKKSTQALQNEAHSSMEQALSEPAESLQTLKQDTEKMMHDSNPELDSRKNKKDSSATPLD